MIFSWPERVWGQLNMRPCNWLTDPPLIWNTEILDTCDFWNIWSVRRENVTWPDQVENNVTDKYILLLSRDFIYFNICINGLE